MPRGVQAHTIPIAACQAVPPQTSPSFDCCICRQVVSDGCKPQTYHTSNRSCGVIDSADGIEGVCRKMTLSDTASMVGSAAELTILVVVVMLAPDGIRGVLPRVLMVDSMLLMDVSVVC